MKGLLATRSAPSRSYDIIGLAVFLAICLGVSGIGGAVTATSVGSWYQALQKPSFNPPDWVFAPVWTTLYVMIAIAGWWLWRRVGLRPARTAFAVYAVQLALNLAWSILFFSFRMIGAALIEVVVLLAAVLVTQLMFWRQDRVAGLLFVPYAAWVSFAMLLNAALWALN